MIDIVAVLFSPKVTPSDSAVSGITRVMINEESFGSYIVSSMMFTAIWVSCPKEGSNNTLGESSLKSAAINKHQKFSWYLTVMKYVYLLVAVINEEITWILKLVVKTLEETTVMFRVVPSVTLYVVFINDTYRTV